VATSCVALGLPKRLLGPCEMRSSKTLALWGSLQLAWPMGVMTTVGFTAFTRIWTGTGRDQQGGRGILDWVVGGSAA
jgi:hypothetical protein